MPKQSPGAHRVIVPDCDLQLSPGSPSHKTLLRHDTSVDTAWLLENLMLGFTLAVCTYLRLIESQSSSPSQPAGSH